MAVIIQPKAKNLMWAHQFVALCSSIAFQHSGSPSCGLAQTATSSQCGPALSVKFRPELSVSSWTMKLPLFVTTPCSLAGAPHDIPYILSCSFHFLLLISSSQFLSCSVACFTCLPLLSFFAVSISPDTCLPLPIFPCLCSSHSFLWDSSSHPHILKLLVTLYPFISVLAQLCYFLLPLPHLSSSTQSSLVALPSASLPADLWVSEWSPGGGEPLPGSSAVEWKQRLTGRVHHCTQCHPEWFRPLYLQRVPGVRVWGTSPLCEDHTTNPTTSHRGGWDSGMGSLGCLALGRGRTVCFHTKETLVEYKNPCILEWWYLKTSPLTCFPLVASFLQTAQPPCLSVPLLKAERLEDDNRMTPAWSLDSHS